MHALISGAGVAGLILAHTLETILGATVDVIDRYPSNATSGGFAFLLLSNGVQGLKQLGLWESVSSVSTRIVNVSFYYATTGHLLGEECMKPDTYIVSRGPFLDAILSQRRHSIRKATLALSAAKDAESSPSDHVPPSRYDFVAGCEGARSPTRTWMNPDASVFSVGTFELMGLLSPVDSARLRSSLVPGHLHKYLASETGLAMGVVVLHSGDVLWYFQVNEDNHAL
ncbi:hypothetical protein As57867_005241, partial [Aphanomyces stellatus]